MDENKSKRTDLEIANDFDRLFDEILAPETDDEIKAFLIEVGYDPATLKAQGAKFVDELMANNWRFVPTEEINQTTERIDQIPLRTDWNRSRLTTAIQQAANALASIGRQPVMAFRNLDELTEADLATILQQLEYKARTNGIDLDLT